MNDSDEEGLIETAKANSASVSDAFARASTLKDFLRDEDARVSIVTGPGYCLLLP